VNKKETQALFRSIEAGRLPNIDDVEVILNGRTPLMHALMCGRAEIASHLVDKGAQVNAIERDGARWPVLHFAARAAANMTGKPEHVAVVSLLISRGADPKLEDAFGNTALDRALLDYDVRSNHWQVIEMLIGAKRDNTAAFVATNARRYSAQVLALFGIGSLG
jgi:ankyrin repeat protein